MTNFRKIEIKAFSKDEAIEKSPFTMVKGSNCTQAWINADRPVEESLKEFMAEQLKSKTKFAEGIGCYIVLDAGVPDTRERPYVFNNVVSEGKRHATKTIMLIDDDNRIVSRVVGTKEDAVKTARELYTEHGFRGNLRAEYVYTIDKGEPLAFTVDYTPSKNTKLGTYLMFGVDA